MKASNHRLLLSAGESAFKPVSPNFAARGFLHASKFLKFPINSAIALALVLFFAGSAGSITLLAYQEISNGLDFGQTSAQIIPPRHQVLGAFVSGNVFENFDSQGRQAVKFDTDGNAIDAHDGEIQYFNGAYYLYGTSYGCGFKYLSMNYNQTPFCGFKVYSSADLRNWKFERLLFDPSAWQGQTLEKNCPNIGCFRPHVLQRPANAGGGYVLWFNIAREKSYWVMESSSPAGPFANPHLAQNVHFTWNGDEALFLDGDNTAYLVHTNYNTNLPEVGDLVIEKLNAGFTDSTGEMVNTGFEGEAPTLIKRNGIYYMLYSHNCPYCSGTATRYVFASSINGPWQDGGIINSNSCGGQPTYVATLNGEYLYMSDLWHASTPPGTIFSNQGLGNYYWGPLTFDANNKPVLSCQSASGADSFVSACDIGSAQLIQTFKPANSGQLNSVDFVTYQSGPQSRPDSKNGSLDGSILPNADLSVQVVKLSGNQPMLPALASFNVQPRKTTDGYITPSGKIDFAANKISFPMNVSVEGGQEYGLLLKSDLTNAGCYGYVYNDSNTYGQGRLLKSSSAGAGFSEETGRDIKFNLGFSSAPAAPNNRPVGYLDGISSSGNAFGWAADNDNMSQTVKVHLYFDKNAGQYGASPVEAVAGDYRGDVGAHAYNYQIPSQLRDGQYHQVWVWAIDLTDNAYNTMLIGSPKTFRLTSTPVTQPTPTPTPIFTTAPTPTPTPSPLACVNRQFNSATSGIYSGSSKVTSLNPGQNFTLKCDYGVVSGYITLEGSGAAGCNWSGWSGTSALFNCAAPLQGGSYSAYCKMTNNRATDNSCSALNLAASYTVQTQTAATAGLTRAQAAKKLIDTFPATAAVPSIPTFSDVPYGDPNYTYIEQLYSRGITGGCEYNAATGARKFCPSDPVTNWQMAVFLGKILSNKIDLSQAPQTQIFKDVLPSHPAYGYVQYFYAKNVVSPCQTNADGSRNFCPDQNLTATQADAFISLARAYAASYNSPAASSPTLIPTPSPTPSPAVLPAPTPSPAPSLSPTPTPAPAVKVNVASAASGAVAVASSVYSGPSGYYTAASAIDGDRTGANWGNNGGWNDNTQYQYPDWLEVDFNGQKTISEIDVYTLKDDIRSLVQPDENTTFTLYGNTDFDVQYFNGFSWQTVPGGSITGNNKVLRKIAFSPLVTSKIRVVVNKSLYYGYSRIIEVEAY